MAYTLTKARNTALSEYLDDDNTRWLEADVDSALQAALSQTFSEYVQSGSRFDEVVTATSTSGGVVDLSSYDPFQVRSVGITTGSLITRLKTISPSDVQYLDSEARSVRAVIVRTPVMGSAAQPLVSDGAGNALQTWDAFDELVCIRAAMKMSVRDGGIPRSLVEIEARFIEAVMDSPSAPRSRMPPTKGSDYANWLYWYYDASAQSAQLCRKVFR